MNITYSLDQDRALATLNTVIMAHKHFVPTCDLFVTRVNGDVWATVEYKLTKLVSAATVITWFQNSGANGVIQSTQGDTLSVTWKVD